MTLNDAIAQANVARCEAMGHLLHLYGSDSLPNYLREGVDAIVRKYMEAIAVLDEIEEPTHER